ncbi:hypothetical protein NEOLEDRAFT_92273 [Neolentinus lepideus HHB14362 ss-1]|uniref:Uncharacterized protein n=1 Tax=Neolentinus lepideus HHB14362 ss-1 TaxID=1314782 RepID=A0A165U1Z4_9AGAM|nr:hypothetical protein NEOLEDRAFT_92273 [Neolentinus lepideus HHB14362 ss-1]
MCSRNAEQYSTAGTRDNVFSSARSSRFRKGRRADLHGQLSSSGSISLACLRHNSYHAFGGIASLENQVHIPQSALLYCAILDSIQYPVPGSSRHQHKDSAVGICRHWFWYRGFTGPFTISTAGEALFLIRIYALYGQSRKVLLVIGPLYLSKLVICCSNSFTSWLPSKCSSSCGLVLVILEVGSVSATPRPPDYPIPGCLATLPRYVNLSYMSWGISMTASCIYFLLTLYKFIISLRPAGEPVSGITDIFIIFESRRFAPVFYLFVRDGTFYFFVIFGKSEWQTTKSLPLTILS